ncbi:MAG: hypothetical protein E6P95_03000 [Candidatus Moraniibacteriota bacterium]|nr:MAG: hypothetical protein E6P95_03000 [Candidatus Moranbacteria bacterium]
MQQQTQAQISASKPSRRGRGGQRFQIVRNGQLINGLTEAQLSGLIDWTHCDGEHKGVKVESLHIGKAGDTKVAIATGDRDGRKFGIKLYDPAELLVAMSRLDQLCHQVHDGGAKA